LLVLHGGTVPMWWLACSWPTWHVWRLGHSCGTLPLWYLQGNICPGCNPCWGVPPVRNRLVALSKELQDLLHWPVWPAADSRRRPWQPRVLLWV